MAARPDENAVSPPQPQAPDVDNPFLLETETGGGVESPAPAAVPDPTATPPSYTEALTQRRPRTGELQAAWPHGGVTMDNRSI